MAAAVAGFLVALVVAEAPAPPVDGPFLEIVESIGAVGAGANGARWDRVQLRMRLINRLPVSVSDLFVEVRLLDKSDGGERAIPGWRLEESFPGTQIAASDEAEIFIDRPLAAQRRTRPAAEIAYRPRVLRYRLSRPDFDIAIALLGSSVRADQRAALLTYDLPPSARERDWDRVRLAATKVLDDPGDYPDSPSVLRLLLGLRAASGLSDGRLVPRLLSLPARLNANAWGEAVLSLAETMIHGSDRTDPRLELLPLWARNTFDKTHRRTTVIEDVVTQAIIRMGDPAVPFLLIASQLHVDPKVRAHASRLLHALGRSTIRTQLSLRDRSLRAAVISALGEIKSADAVVPLVEVVRGRDRTLRRAAIVALGRIGPAAVEPLVGALATPNKPTRLAITKVLVAIGDEQALRRAANKYGVPTEGKDAPALCDALADRLFGIGRDRWTNELTRGLELGGQGRYREAFAILDRVYAADGELYMKTATPIAQLYLQRAHDLYDAGNYDAAGQTLRVGQSIQQLPEADALLLSTQVALARGYLDLGQLDRADAMVDAVGDEEAVREIRAALLIARAQKAIRVGDYGRARNLVHQAQALAPDHPEIHALDVRLMVRENAMMLAIAALVIPLALLIAAILVRRRFERRRLHALIRG